MGRSPLTLPSVEYLRECFVYDPGSGALRWRTRPLAHFINSSRWKACNTRFAGTITGVTNREGYLIVCLDYRSHLAHRLIWKLVTGNDPIAIDHSNGERHDNRWSNIREATPSQNQWNKRVNSSNMTGLKGVRRQPSGRYGSYIWMPNGKSRWLGTFETADEAHAAYCEAARELGGDFYSPG